MAPQTSHVPKRENLNAHRQRLRAFVFGATGYVGGATVERLAEDPDLEAVVAHVRPGSPSLNRARERFGNLKIAGSDESVSLDTTPLEAVAFGETLRRLAPTHLFICHGTTARRARSEGIDDPYNTVDVGLTALVCKAAARQESPPRVVYLSSVGASRKARGAYLRARGEAEEVIRSSGLPFTICQAPLLTGLDRPEYRRAEVWARRLLDPTLRLMGAAGLTRVRDRYLSMDAAEAAEGLVRTGFHYMTIARTVKSDELRREGVYERERWVPASRRDTDRF